MQPHLRLGKDAVSKFYNDTSGAINHSTAGGMDADRLVRRIKQEQSEDIHQALNMNKTDKF